ncbi:MAG: hypothetical protein Q8N08_00065 [Methanobacteriaceae archaeon]|nr:hypothetical protein [Methanobacteriaceae archaeon]
MGLWECSKCGYNGSVIIENGNLEKNVKEAHKLDNLSKNLLGEGNSA